MPKNSSLACRSCSGPFFAYVSSALRISVNAFSDSGNAKSRRNSRCATVFRRWVAPGWPEVNTGSPSLGAGRGPRQEVLRHERLAVLVDAPQRHVEAIPREGEVVGVAAVERRVELGREDEPHVGELLVEIQVVLAALVERDDLGSSPVPACASFSIAAMAARRAASVSADDMPGFTAAFTFAVTSSIFCSVSSSRSGAFISCARVGGEKALAGEIAIGRAQLVQQVERHVVVGQHQAVG